MTVSRIKIIFVFLILPFISGCVFFGNSDLPIIVEDSIELSGDQILGQTFVSRLDGLSGMEIYMSSASQMEGHLIFHLRKEPEANQDLVISTLSGSMIVEPGYYTFSFEPQPKSNQKYYYFCIEFKGTGNIKVGSASGDDYLDGSMYLNHQPVDQQLVFRPIYDLSRAFLGWVRELFSWIGILLASIFLFVIPGLALIILLIPKSTLSATSKLALACAISVALYPVIFLWTNTIGIHAGLLYALIPPIVGGIYLVWKYRSWRPSLRFSSMFRQWAASGSFLLDLAILVILGISLLIRFYLARSLDVPLWGDSVHHTMITQLLVMKKGLFGSWEPLAELQSLTYHFGFHANAAVFHWITGKSLPQSVLWTGQIFNFLAIFSLVPLIQKASGGKWGGSIAILIAGLLSSMPNFYINWGRYPQLTGQIILPVVVYLIWETFECEIQNWRLTTLTCITLAGLGLSHYRILIFAVIFFIPLILMNLKKKDVLQQFLKPVWIALGSGVLFLPWFIHTFQGRITSNFLRSLSTPAAAATDWTQQYNAIGELFDYLPPVLWIVFGAAILWSLIKKKKETLLISSWWFLILLATNPQWLLLPGEGAISNFAFFIAAYLPCALIVGIVFGEVIPKIPSKVTSVFPIILILLSIWSIKPRLEDLNYQNHTLMTRPDVIAAEWIKANTAQDAKFLTNAFLAYNDTVIVGSDGGWWLRMLANRDTTLPPISYGTEKGPRSDYRIWINTLIVEISTKGITHPDVLAMLQERKVSHIYIGQRSGRVNYKGPDLLPLDTLLTSEHFQLIYHMDRIWIFEII